MRAKRNKMQEIKLSEEIAMLEEKYLKSERELGELIATMWVNFDGKIGDKVLTSEDRPKRASQLFIKICEHYIDKIKELEEKIPSRPVTTGGYM